MCRNITTLRGLEPEVTTEEIEAAARQYVRKVSGVTSSSARTDPAVERAVTIIARNRRLARGTTAPPQTSEDSAAPAIAAHLTTHVRST
jgi:hypothetical protein